MGVPESGLHAADCSTAESLLTAFRTIKPAERQKHAAVLDYWLSIRGDNEFPPLHDLDPLEISDAGPCSILLELIGGGQDAEIRHLGEALQSEVNVSRIIDASSPSLLSNIARKLPIVSISRDFLAFEDSFSTSSGLTRCWVTLLPLSSCGSWVDYVYAFVTLDSAGAKPAPAPEPVLVAEVPPVVEIQTEQSGLADEPTEEVETAEEPVAFATGAASNTVDDEAEAEPVELLGTTQSVGEPEVEEAADSPAAKSAPGFSKLLDGIANLTGFYGQGVNVDAAVPTVEPAKESMEAEPQAATVARTPATDAVPVETADAEAATDDELLLVEPDGSAPDIEPDVAEAASTEQIAKESAEAPEPEGASQTAPIVEGPLQDQLAQVRAKAEEARQAQLRVTQALHESLSAAYDFALDAEGSPEEYLRLVEAQGVKIQLRAPMAPVARMAFDDVCDAVTIRQFEAVLAWALKVELPRGALLERIEQAGGVPELLDEFSKAA